MTRLPESLLDQLCELAQRLRSESEDFLEQHQDAQLWYNRGYANGMLLGLAELLGEQLPCGLQADDPTLLQGHEVMAWGKAYRHGESMGRKETFEIAGST